MLVLKSVQIVVEAFGLLGSQISKEVSINGHLKWESFKYYRIFFLENEWMSKDLQELTQNLFLANVSSSLFFLSVSHSRTLGLILCSCSCSPKCSPLDYQYVHVVFICGEFSNFLVITENLCAKFNSMNYMTNLQQCRRHQGDRETARLSCQVSQQS